MTWSIIIGCLAGAAIIAAFCGAVALGAWLGRR